MIENIHVLRHLWSKDDEPFAGEFTSFSNVTLEPKPVQSPCPIWLATNAERLSKGQADSGGSELALGRVGKIADGWMTHSVSPDGFRRSWDFILAAGRDDGRDMSGFDNVLYHHVNVNDDKAECAGRFQEVPRPLLFGRLQQGAAGGVADLWPAARLHRPPQAIQGVGLPAHYLPDFNHARSDDAIAAPGRGRAAVCRLETDQAAQRYHWPATDTDGVLRVQQSASAEERSVRAVDAPMKLPHRRCISRARHRDASTACARRQR